MAVRMPEDVAKRLFHRVFICIYCNAKMRADHQKILQGKVKCRRCGHKKFRAKAKEKRGMRK
jgi:ribosomal protein L40E